MRLISIAEAHAKAYSEAYGSAVGYEGPFATSTGDAFTFHFTDKGMAQLDAGLPFPIVVVGSSGQVSEIPFSSQEWFEIAGEIPNEDDE